MRYTHLVIYYDIQLEMRDEYCLLTDLRVVLIFCVRPSI